MFGEKSLKLLMFSWFKMNKVLAENNFGIVIFISHQPVDEMYP